MLFIITRKKISHKIYFISGHPLIDKLNPQKLWDNDFFSRTDDILYNKSWIIIILKYNDSNRISLIIGYNLLGNIPPLRLQGQSVIWSTVPTRWHRNKWARDLLATSLRGIDRVKFWQWSHAVLTNWSVNKTVDILRITSSKEFSWNFDHCILL